MRVQIAVILMLILCLVPAFSQQKTENAGEPLTLAEKKTYDVALSQFKAVGLSPANSYLVFSIPLLINERIVEIKEHSLSAEESAAIKSILIHQKLAGERQKLSGLQKTKDELLFSTVPAAEKRNNIVKTDKDISQVLDSINYLKNEAQVQVVLPETLPLSVKQGKNVLYDRFEYSILQFARTNKIDLLIDGTIEEIGDYITLEIRAFNANLEKDLYNYKNTGESGKIYDYIAEGITGLVNIVLGRSWASLVINSNFPDAWIYLNGNLVGYGNVELKYIKPEAVRITALYPGYEKEEQELTLVPYETRIVDVVLKAVTLDKITIQTIPPDADLYLNTVWSGKTPLEIEQKAGLMQILLAKEGYNDYQFNLAPEAPNPVVISLDLSSIDPAAIQKKKRDDFYFSFGLALLSIPLPIFCEGYAADYKSAAENNLFSSQERTFFNQTGEILKYVQYGTFALEMTLITNALIKLFAYLDASNQLIE